MHLTIVKLCEHYLVPINGNRMTGCGNFCENQTKPFWWLSMNDKLSQASREECQV